MTPGGPGPPSSPASPAPASSCQLSSPSSGSFLLVLMHPTLVLLKNTKTASVDFFQSHLPEEAFGCFHPCAFPISFYNFLIWGSQALHSMKRWWRVCCFPPPRHQHLSSVALPILSFR